VLARALDVLFPPTCIGCQRRGTPLCDTCRGELPYLPAGVCYRCASMRGAGGVCRGCRHLSAAVSSMRAPFSYAGAARTAVLTLKFRSGRYLVPLMGEFLCETLKHRPLQVDVVVPVPLSPARLRQRGFNQATLLGEQISRRIGAELIADGLVRRERAPQSTLTAEARRVNLQDAFSCRDRLNFENRRVLLIDDVVTTCATVSGCADTLARAGARRVSVLAFARDL